MRRGAGKAKVASAAVAALLFAFAAMTAVVRTAYPLRYEEMILAAAEREGLDPFLVIAVIQVESGFRPEAVSPVGAVGLMQVMPQTAAWIASRRDAEGRSTGALSDPEANIAMGSWYLAYLLDRYGDDRDLALAAYNAGPASIDRWREEDGRLPVAVVGYTERVQGAAARYRTWYNAPLLGRLLRTLPW
jgi:soluble lytic murein transglycosylase